MEAQDDPLLHDLASSNPGVQSHAIKAMIQQVKDGTQPWSYLLNTAGHKYWRVRLDAIEAIIKGNPPDALELLHAFRNTSYHLSQQRIRDYIEARFENGNLSEDQFALAKDILDGLINAPKVTEISRSKNKKLLKRLSEPAQSGATTSNTLNAHDIVADEIVVGTKIVKNYYSDRPDVDHVSILPKTHALVELLNRYFDRVDLQTIAFVMNYDWDNLRGETKSEKAQALTLRAQRDDRLDELIAIMAKERPNLRAQLALL